LKKSSISAAFALVMMSAGALAQVAQPSPASQSGHPMTLSEQATRFRAIASELLREKQQLENDIAQKAGDAAADHEDLEEKLNSAIAHSQALEKQVADLKAKYEPAPAPAAPKSTTP
jgi:DNA repair exonuclease SbcCD ATPase subunit